MHQCNHHRRNNNMRLSGEPFIVIRLCAVFLVLSSFGCVQRSGEHETTGSAAPRSDSTRPAVSQVENATSFHVVVFLRDGSQLVGTSQQPTFAFQTSYGHLEVPLEKIRSVTFADSSGAATIEFSNGDLLHGKFPANSFSLESVLGRLELPVQGMARISLLSPGDALTSGLVAYYPLDGSTEDSSGHGHDGVNHGAVPSKDRFGNSNRAYSFNGSGAYIALPDGLVDPDGAGFTISLWAQARSMDGTRFLAYIGTNSAAAGLVAKNQQFSFIVTLRSHGGFSVSAPAGLNTFVHLACVYTKGKSIALWVNGRPAGETPIPDDALSHGGNDHSSTLGSYAPEQPNHARTYQYWTWDGIIDDVRIYSRALRPEEIAALSRE